MKKKQSELFTTVSANFIPMSVFNILKNISYERRLPISQLISIALDNELDASNPFEYKVEDPNLPYIEGAFFKEANMIFQFLKKNPNGFDKQSLMMCRRDIGIEDRETFILGLRELLQTTMVEVFVPKRTAFNYYRDYTRIRAVVEKPQHKPKDWLR